MSKPKNVEIPNLGSFTIAFWMKTDSRYKTGTIFSYRQSYKMNESLDISVTSTELILSFKTQVVRAKGVLLQDGLWHCIGIVRDRANATVTVFVDGKNVKQQNNMFAGEMLPGGGSVVLGQKYASKSQIFLAADSFVGTIHQLHMWSFSATTKMMWTAAHKCDWPLGGNILAWVNFLQETNGEVTRKFPSGCKGNISFAYHQRSDGLLR